MTAMTFWIRHCGGAAACVIAMLMSTSAPSLARGGHGGAGSGGQGTSVGQSGGGKAHQSTKSGSQPGAVHESGDSKGSGETKMVNASAKPDSDTAATTRPPARKKR